MKSIMEELKYAWETDPRDPLRALGEIPLELWLIVMAVNAERWKEQASAAVQ